MEKDLVTVRNTVTRQVGVVRRRIAEHPVFGVNLEIVPEGSKSYVSLSDKVDTYLGREPQTVEDLVTLEYDSEADEEED